MWIAQYKLSTQNTYAPVIAELTANLDLAELKKLTPETLQATISRLIGAKNSLRTYKIAIRSFLKFAGSEGLCDKALYKSIHIERQNLVPLVTTYVDFKLDHVLSAEANPRNRVILGLAIAAECSIAELIKLTWYDVDSTQAGLTLRPPRKKERKLRFQDPQNPIWLELIALRGDRTDDDYVFHGKQGTGLNYNQVHKIIEEALERAGVKATVGEVCKISARKKCEYLLR